MTISSDSVPTGDPLDAVDSAEVDRTPVASGAGEEHTPSADDARRRRTRRRWIGGGVFAGVVLAALAAAFFIRLPYYLIEPGSVRPAEQRIDVEGARAYRTKGRVLFTTVYLVQATPASWLQSKIDDTIEVIPEATLYPEGRQAGEQTNRAEMDLSKLVATRAALDYLGYDAEFTGDGAVVDAIPSGSPSRGRLQVGDVITEVAGTKIALPSDIGRGLANRAPGQTVTVGVQRNERARTTEVTLGSASDDPQRPVLGVAVSPKSPRVASPVQVEVDSGAVSGPSAGLAWTLAIIDRLTPGSLTRGADVAVTGEMLPDGSVGQIGGIAQKVAAVKRAGIRMFLYPASTSAAEQRRMREVAGTSVQLRPVRTLDEAVDVLAPQGVQRPN